MNENESPLILTSDPISDEKRIVIYILQIFSASLSIIGSSIIVFKILRDRAQSGSITPYDRIILCLSSIDILASITHGVDQFLVPIESGDAWAFGSPTTCRIAGFLFQFFVVWSWWYNAILSYYFLMTVLSQLRQKDCVRKYEVWLHLSGIFIPISAIMGLFLGWYHDELPCIISDVKIGLIIFACPTLFVYLSLIINNIVIYAVVRKSIRSTEHIPGQSLVRKRLRREAAIMMLLYVGCFFVTVTPTLVKLILEEYFGYNYENEGNALYVVWTLQSIFMPLQGFFNVFIYIKPAYSRFRAANPNKTMYFVLHQALFNPNVPQMNSPSEHSIVPANPNDALFNDNFRPPSSSSDSSSSDDSSASSDSS